MTDTRYRCTKCNHTGPAVIVREWDEYHGPNAIERLMDIACAECGSDDLAEIDEQQEKTICGI